MGYQLVVVHSVGGNTVLPVSWVILRKDSEEINHSEAGKKGDSPVDVTLKALGKAAGVEVIDREIAINGGPHQFKVCVEKDGRRETGESQGYDFFTELGNAFIDALNKFQVAP